MVKLHCTGILNCTVLYCFMQSPCFTILLSDSSYLLVLYYTILNAFTMVYHSIQYAGLAGGISSGDADVRSRAGYVGSQK